MTYFRSGDKNYSCNIFFLHQAKQNFLFLAFKKIWNTVTMQPVSFSPSKLCCFFFSAGGGLVQSNQATIFSYFLSQGFFLCHTGNSLPLFFLLWNAVAGEFLLFQPKHICSRSTLSLLSTWFCSSAARILSSFPVGRTFPQALFFAPWNKNHSKTWIIKHDI